MFSIGERHKRLRPTRAQTRQRLIDAAGEVFARLGYEGASLDEVAAAAGLTKGAVYSSFGSKDELFYALMQERIGQRLAAVAETLNDGDTIEGFSTDAGGVLSKLMQTQADWHLLFIEFWARAIRHPELREEFARQRRAAREMTARFLEQRARDVGFALPASADELAVGMLALSNGIAIEQLADPENVPASLYGTLLNLILRSFQMPATGSSGNDADVSDGDGGVRASR